MSKKKSLGHNPLAYSMMGHASFDFISPEQKERDKKGFDDIDGSKSNKISVSYYLEESLVEKIKDLADEHNTSYSAIISQMLKKSLEEHSEG